MYKLSLWQCTEWHVDEERELHWTGQVVFVLSVKLVLAMSQLYWQIHISQKTRRSSAPEIPLISSGFLGAGMNIFQSSLGNQMLQSYFLIKAEYY